MRRRWCRQPRASRRSCRRTGSNRKRKIRLTAMRRRQRPGWRARRRLCHHALLVRRLRLVGAGAAATAAPARFAGPDAADAQGQDRAANRQNIGRSRRKRRGRAGVARGRHERHTGLVKIWAVVRRLARKLAAAPAHRHDIRMSRRVVDGREQVVVMVELASTSMMLAPAPWHAPTPRRAPPRAPSRPLNRWADRLSRRFR